MLNRAGFGGAPSAINNLHAMGREKAVDFLLQPTELPDAFAEPEWCKPEKVAEEARRRFQLIRDNRIASRDMTPEEADRKRREIQQSFQRDERRRGMEAQGWWLSEGKKDQARENRAAILHRRWTGLPASIGHAPLAVRG